MIVEPFAQNELENNVNPVASTFYAASTLTCPNIFSRYPFIILAELGNNPNGKVQHIYS
jgi:hypothetical protein